MYLLEIAFLSEARFLNSPQNGVLPLKQPVGEQGHCWHIFYKTTEKFLFYQMFCLFNHSLLFPLRAQTQETCTSEV